MSRDDAELPRLAGPGSIAELSELMARAHAESRTVAVFGGGTAFDDHPPAATPGLLIDLSGLAEVAEHSPEDGTLRAGAGAKISALNRVAGRSGQRLSADLPLDRIEAGASLGGVIATGAAGPGRFGRPRLADTVRAVTVVAADGTIARTTEGVVPSLGAGSLASLMTGSWGGLAIIAGAEVALQAEPESSGFVWIPGIDAAIDLPMSRLVPAAVEIERPPGSPAATVALLEGAADAVETGLERIAGHYAGATPCARPAWWARRSRVPVTIHVSAAPAFIPTLLQTVSRLEDAIGYPLQLRGSARGVFELGVGAPETEPGVAARVVLEHLRSWGLHNVSVRLLSAPASVWEEVDPWGPLPGLKLRRETKRSFDPHGLLAPGRGLGGL